MRNESRFALPLLAAFALSCASDGGEPPSVASVAVTPNPATVEVGAARQFTAVARDANGDVVSGRTFTWNSTATGTATVSTAGLATGVAAGLTTIRAETGGVTGSAQLTVTAPGPASVTIEPDSADVAEGQTVQLAAVVRDGDGMIITASVNWSSGNTSVATVDGSGLVMGESQGTAEITASAGGVDSDPAIIVVIPPVNITVSSISPDPMVEGQSATIQGEGFSATASENNVTINGFSAPVTSASDTQLTIDVPEECFPAGDVTLAIVTPTGSSGAVTHPMQPAIAPLSMAVGEFMLIQDPADFCLQLAEELLNEEYAFGLQSTSESVSSLTGVRVRGQIPSGMAGVNASALMPPASPSGPAMSLLEAAGRPDRRAHLELMERNRNAFSPALRGTGLAASATAVPDGLAVDDTIPIKVPNIEGDICNDFTDVEAVVRIVGTNAVWLEQVDNPAGGLSAAQYQDLSDDFDSVTFPTDTAYFGAVTDFDANDYIAIVVSREVNGTQASGFVVSSDFVGACPSSNGGEVFYMVSPDPDGQFGTPITAAELAQGAPPLLAHELVHIIQFGRRIDQGRPQFQAVWELESQATLGEEVVGWAFNGRTREQNYDVSVMGGTGLPNSTPWHGFGFGVLTVYFGFQGDNLAKAAGAPEQCSFLDRQNNGPCVSSLMPYMPYIFLRWLNDHEATNIPGERALQRSMIDSDLAGYANIEAAIGEPIEALLGHWAASLYADDRVVGLEERASVPSWDLASLDDLPDPDRHLQPRSFGFATFSSDVSVRAGSSAYYLISGVNRPSTSVRARDGSGAPLPELMQMWIVRLQ